MKQRTQQAWQQLIKQQSNGDLSILDFCKQQKISARCFYKHKAINKTQTDSQESAFIKAKTPQQRRSKLEPIKLQQGLTRIHFPTSIQPSWLAELIKALA